MENKETPRKNSREVNPVPDATTVTLPVDFFTDTLPDAATSTPILPAQASVVGKNTAEHARGRPRRHAGRHSGHPLEGDAKRAAERKRFIDRQAQAAKQVGAFVI